MRTLQVCEVEAVTGGFIDNNGNGIDDRYEEGYQEPAPLPPYAGSNYNGVWLSAVPGAGGANLWGFGWTYYLQ